VLNHDLGNQILPLPFKTPTLDAYLYWHATADADPANSWFRGLLLQAFKA
jgi:DNA-binding transcriptional LysR family regulator